MLKVERTEQGRAKIAGPEVQQEKTTETHGKHREKTLSSQQCAPDRVVVENNSLGDGWNSLLSTGERDYVDAAASWKQFATNQGLSPEETQAGLDKIAKGELPEGLISLKLLLKATRMV